MRDKGILYKANEILMSSHKKKAPFIVFLLCVSSLLDFISLASFLPVILLILNPLHSTEIPWMQNWNIVGAIEPSYIAVIFTILILFFIILKTQINLRIARRKATYAYKISADLASLALTQYLTSPYCKFTNTDYTKEMNRISNLPLMFANNIVIPAATVLSEGLLLAMFFIGVAIYDIKVLGFVILMTSPVGLAYWYKRKKMKHISEEVKTIYPRLLKYTLEALEGFPEIKAFGKENYFKKRFNATFQKLSKVFTSDHVVNTSAQRTTELIAAMCVGALIIYALLQKNPVQETVLLLSIYAGVSFRAIPAVNRIFSASLQMKSHEYVLHDLQDLIAPQNEAVEETEVPLLFNSKIELRNICFRYEEHFLILKNASLTIQKGERVVFTGESGVGKTSLFLILMRFMNEDSGEILVDGKEIVDLNVANWRKLIGYVPQNPFILDATIAENIAFGVSAEKIDVAKVSRLIRELNLDSWVINQKHGLNTIIGEKGSRISGGQKQRLAIARALYHDAEILLLDEVTNQLDKQTEIEVLHALNGLADERKTILLITHRPELWHSFDTLYELKAGKFLKLIQKEIYTN
jgi:ABC-type multidrug transport system fused ATPase/permease subunit